MGPTGPQGPIGPTSPQGPQGEAGTIVAGPAVADLDPAADAATIVTSFNALLASLRQAGVIANDAE